jgi:signal transduction histidine kinase
MTAIAPILADDPRATAAAAPAPGVPALRSDDLAQIIAAYNQVTENLQRSHESLASQVQRLEERLASADAQLQRSRRLAALGEMAAGIAHEIRNPLGAIQLYVGMLEQDLAQLASLDTLATTSPADPVAMLDTARRIASAVRGLNSIVTDVVTFSREIEPQLAPVDAHDALAAAVQTLAPVLDASAISVELQRSQPLLMHADAQLLHQALLNLLRNAVQAMTDNTSAPRRLTLACRAEPPCVVLTVRDTGPGIAQQNIDRIFNPFFTTRSTGTGLGLAIVHRIIDAHGGAITVANDRGAVFEIRLPAEHSGDIA